MNKKLLENFEFDEDLNKTLEHKLLWNPQINGNDAIKYYKRIIQEEFVNKGIKIVLSFSGGKDSTALLLKCIDENIHIDEVIFCDTGVEFNELYQHISKIKQICDKNDIIFTILKSKNGSFIDLIKNKIHFWPNSKLRWCSAALKRDVVRPYLKKKYGRDGYIQMIGFAYDDKEQERAAKKLRNTPKCEFYLFPLIMFQMKEKDCLKYCLDKGYDFGGLYNKFERLGCALCPLQRKGDLIQLGKHYPEWVDKIRQIEKDIGLPFKDKGIDYWIKEKGGDK